MSFHKLPGKFHYSSRGRKESDIIEHTHTHTLIETMPNNVSHLATERYKPWQIFSTHDA